jgi:hypothetical protein
MNLKQKRAWFVGAGLVVFSLALAQSAGEPIKRLIAGSGLIGGGSGPSTTVAIAPDGVTSEHIQDGTIQLDDISSDAQSSLRGSPGGVSMRALHQDGPSFVSLPPNVASSTNISFTLTHRALIHVTCHDQYSYDLAVNGATGSARCSTSLHLISLTNSSQQSRATECEMRVGNYPGRSDLTFPMLLEPGLYQAYVVRTPVIGAVLDYDSSIDVDIVEQLP